MRDVSALYWDPTGPHHIYGRAKVELEGQPASRHDKLEPVVVLVPSEFVVMFLPKGSAVDAAWQGVVQGEATFEDRDPLSAAWLQGSGLFRLQSGGSTLLVHFVPQPGKWLLLLAQDEETAKASLPSDVFTEGNTFVEVPSVLDLVP